MYDFHMDFQFPGQKSLPRDLQMDMASPWQLKWASFLAMGLLVQILFSRHSLCIYPYVKTCPFFLRPTFFSKNQPTGQGQPGVSQGHLEVPWECQIGPKLKIYVKIIYFEQISFWEFFWLFMIFGTLYSEKCQFLGKFDQNLCLPQ